MVAGCKSPFWGGWLEVKGYMEQETLFVVPPGGNWDLETKQTTTPSLLSWLLLLLSAALWTSSALAGNKGSLSLSLHNQLGRCFSSLVTQKPTEKVWRRTDVGKERKEEKGGGNRGCFYLCTNARTRSRQIESNYESYIPMGAIKQIAIEN